MPEAPSVALLFALLAAMAVAAGCGGAKTEEGRTHVETSRAASSGSPRIGYHPGEADHDSDSDDNDYYDEDDNAIVYFGRPALKPARKEIVQLLETYYAAMFARYGARVCSLFVPAVAATVPLHYGGSSEPNLRGRTCAAVMSKVLEPVSGSGVTTVPKIVVKDVRVEGPHALALYNFGHRLNRNMPVLREDGDWKLDALSDGGLP